MSTNTDAAIWERVVQFEEGLSPTAARALLKLQFSASYRQQMRELATKARAGIFTAEEERRPTPTTLGLPT
jgi:hypothetical protein